MTLCLCLCFLFLYILYFPSHLLAHIVCISLLFLVNSSFISSDSSRFALNQSLQTLLTCFILFLFYLFSPLTLSLFLSNFFLVSLCRLFFLFPSLNLYLCVFSPSLHFVFYPSLCLSHLLTHTIIFGTSLVEKVSSFVNYSSSIQLTAHPGHFGGVHSKNAHLKVSSK